MNSEAQTALEALAGRALTADEIALADARNDTALAASISTTLPPIIVPHEIGEGTVLEVLGLAGGTVFLDALAGNPQFKYVCKLLERGTLDVGKPLVRSNITALADAGLIPTAAATALLALAERPDRLDTATVSAALNRAYGLLTL